MGALSTRAGRRCTPASRRCGHQRARSPCRASPSRSAWPSSTWPTGPASASPASHRSGPPRTCRRTTCLSGGKTTRTSAFFVADAGTVCRPALRLGQAVSGSRCTLARTGLRRDAFIMAGLREGESAGRPARLVGGAMVSASGTDDGTSAASLAPRMPQPAARRKFWGWGLEGEGLAVSEIEQLGSTFAGRFGIDGVRVQEPPRVDELDLRAPRLAPPASLEAAFSTDPYDRAAHTYGRSFRDLVRAFRRDYAHAPDLVAFPGSEGELVSVLEWCSDAGAAAIPFGGGSSVVGGVEPDVGGGYHGAVSVD